MADRLKALSENGTGRLRCNAKMMHVNIEGRDPSTDWPEFDSMDQHNLQALVCVSTKGCVTRVFPYYSSQKGTPKKGVYRSLQKPAKEYVIQGGDVLV